MTITISSKLSQSFTQTAESGYWNWRHKWYYFSNYCSAMQHYWHQKC